MIYTNFYIQKYDWYVDIYFDAYSNNTDTIIENLYYNKTPYKCAVQIYDMIISEKLNTGVIYTNYNLNKSIIIIYRAASIGEYINTIVHELRHLQEHISIKYNISSDSEEVCYLIGNLAKSFYYSIKNYIKSSHKICYIINNVLSLQQQNELLWKMLFLL